MQQVGERFAERLGAWLASRTGATDVTLGPVDRPGSGLSGNTLFVEAMVGETGPGGEEGGPIGSRAHRPGGVTADATARWQLVVRIPPPDGQGLFPKADLAKEVAFARLLDDAGIPAAPVVGLEEDAEILGAPFLVTRRVSGRVVNSNEPYLCSGWLAESGADFQARLGRDLLGVMARINRIQAPGAFTRHDSGASPGIAGAVEDWGRYYLWAADGQRVEVVDSALEWCSRNRPADEPPESLLWGDPQIANTVFSDDGSVAAVVDFELATAGPAELDVGWFFCLHDMTVARCGGDLPGFVDRAALVAAYEETLGRPLRDLAWYEVFAACCTASILVRMSKLLERRGVDAGWLARRNPAIDFLVSRLG